MATPAVLKYLQNQNRPFSANDLVSNLKDYGKSAIQKGLDDLVSKGKVLEKVYGKQKVYCIVQNDQNVDPDKLRDEMDQMEKTILNLSETLQSQEQKIKNTEFELKNLANSMTTEEAKKEKEKLEKEVDRLKTKLKALSEVGTPISPEEKSRIEKEHEKYMKEYRKRKRICMEIIDSILEGYPKKKKDLIEELGIETDEEVGCVLGK